MRNSIFALATCFLITGCGDDTAGTDMQVNPDLTVTGAHDLSVAHDLTTTPGDGAMGVAFAKTVTLTKGAESPVCASAGANATGSATVNIDAADTMVAVTAFTFSGLSAAATAAHIHVGAAGTAGNVVFNFGANPVSPVTKTFTAADYPTTVPAGAPATFAAFLEVIKGGGSYINVHTAACTGGEIRAQIQ